MDIKRIFIVSFRMYFAPIVGAYKEVMIERERLQQRLTSSPPSAYGCRLRGKDGDSYS
jgi:hypothetical protein